MCIGITFAIVFLMQPWRSCAYGESADCHALPEDSLRVVVSLLVALLGLVVLSMAIVRRRREGKLSGSNL
jgi:hypothetical protein